MLGRESTYSEVVKNGKYAAITPFSLFFSLFQVL